MGRILFFLLLALAAYIGWRLWRVQQARPGRDASSESRARARGGEAMVRCEVCGLNVPQSEALPAPDSDAQRWYCCEEHRRQDGARG
jgi:uncharacterized protein